MYQVKPKVKSHSIAVAKKNRESKKQKQDEEAKSTLEAKIKDDKKRNEKEKQAKQLQTDMVTAIKSNTQSIELALNDLKDQIAQVELIIPDFPEIPDSSAGVRDAITALATQVSKIKLDVQVKEVDLSSHTKSLNAANKRNSDNLGKILESLQQQIETIRFEAPEPVREWSFDFTRDNMGFTKSIKATAKRTLN